MRTAGALHRVEQRADSFPLCRADEKNLALAGLLRVREPPDRKSPVSDLLALHHIFQRRAEGILTHNTDPDRVGRTREGARRPLHELGKVVEKRGLDLILVEAPGAWARSWSAAPSSMNRLSRRAISVGLKNAT